MLSRHFSRLIRVPKRTFIPRELITPDASPQDLKNNDPKRPGLIRYNRGELEYRPYLVLRSQQNIQEYVISLVKNYFRTTYKEGVTINSFLFEHGLDSLDAIELAMIIEEDLGYDVATETLPNFHRVSHFVNYISQVEKFKKTYRKVPLA